jgi:hypothetical protein
MRHVTLKKPILEVNDKVLDSIGPGVVSHLDEWMEHAVDRLCVRVSHSCYQDAPGGIVAIIRGT